MGVQWDAWNTFCSSYLSSGTQKNDDSEEHLEMSEHNSVADITLHILEIKRQDIDVKEEIAQTMHNSWEFKLVREVCLFFQIFF